MGWGACRDATLTQRRRPKGFEPAPGSTAHLRPHCTEFYWNIASAVAKTACLSLFLVVEGPRRLHALVLRQPEPEPVFTCARAGGFRVCACGHHFYDHKGLADGEGEASFLDDTADSAFLRDMREPAKADRRSPVIRSGKRHRRRWYWPF